MAEELAADSANPDESVFQEIAKDIELLTWLQDQELDQAALQSLQVGAAEDWFALPPVDERAQAGFTLLRDTLRQYREQELEPQSLLNELAADYAGLFVTHSYRASPCESVWMTEDSLTHQEPMFAVRDWYKKYELSVPNWRERSDDHLVFQLEFLAKLIRMGSEQALLDAGRFLDQHLMNWIEDFSTTASQHCRTPFYAGLVLITNSYVFNLRDILEELTGEERKALEEKPPEEAVIEFHSQPYIPGAQPSW